MSPLTDLSADGEAAAVKRFEEAHARGVRRWRDDAECDVFEVIEVVDVSGIPCVRLITARGERRYTMRSSRWWTPIEPAPASDETPRDVAPIADAPPPVDEREREENGR